LTNESWPRLLPFAAFIALLAIRGALGDGNDQFSLWLYALQAGLPAVLLTLLWPRFSELAVTPRGGGRWFAAVVLGLAVFLFWIHATEPWMRLGQPLTSFVPEAPDGLLQWPLIAVRLAGSAAVVPVIEELFWRSFVMRRLDGQGFEARSPQKTSGFAWVASSAVFALEHDLWLAGFAAGMAYGWLFIRTGNLWFPVIAHATTNFALGLWVVAERQWQFW
jgi:CAAX prenyl protease-like protein